MGFLSDCWDSVKSSVSSAWSKAKEVAGKAVVWMAEKAEGFIGSVKNVWGMVKPYVNHIRAAIQFAARAVPYPWLKSALLILDQGIGALTAFENSPILKKIQAAIDWAIQLAKRWQAQRETAESSELDGQLTEEELEKAKRYQQDLRFAEREIPEEYRHQMELTSAINDFEIARADLSKTVDKGVSNFEHYLRLRATQKLLGMVEKRFHEAQSIDDLSADDIFLTRIASDLIKENPELSQEAALRLDRLLTERYGRTLAPFVYEEIVASWGQQAKELAKTWTEGNKKFAQDSAIHKRLSVAKQIEGELAPAEEEVFTSLGHELPARKRELDDIAAQQRDVSRYVGAAEGFLQVLEKSEEELEAEDRGYLLDESEQVGRLLIYCAENETPFSMLSAEDQSLITDYANIFKAEADSRMERLLEITA